MTEARVTQASKVAIVGGDPDALVSQAAKIILLSIGTQPSEVSQVAKIIIGRLEGGDPEPPPPPPPGLPARRRGFMNFVP